MDPRQHDGLFESVQEVTTSLRMTPDVPHRFRTSLVSRLIVAVADIFNGRQLAKISDEDYRYIAKVEFLWNKTQLRKIPAAIGCACGRKMLCL